MKTIFSFRNLALVCAISAFAFIGCVKDNDDNGSVSGLMAANLATDVTVDITLSGNLLTSSPLIFSNYTGGYLSIFPGSRTVESFNAASGVSLALDSYTFQPDQYYSLFVAGANGNYRNIIVHDNFDSLATVSGQAYIRYVNAIPDSSAPVVKITASGSEEVNTTAGFATISSFIAVPAGDIMVEVSNGSTINASRTITVEDRKIYTILLIGNPDNAEVRFITNGTLDEDANKMSSVNSVSSD
jgi:hypothetical protein